LAASFLYSYFNFHQNSCYVKKCHSVTVSNILQEKFELREMPNSSNVLCLLQADWLSEMKYAALRLQKGDRPPDISATDLSGQLISLTRWKMNHLLIAMITFLMTCI